MAFDDGAKPGKEDFLEKFVLLLESERFKKAVKEIKTERTIERIVEVPKFVDIDVERAKFTEKEVEVPKYIDVVLDRISYQDKIVEVPKYVDKIIEVEKVKINTVTKDVLVDQVKLVPVEQKVEIPFNVDKPVIVEREVIVDKPKFRETIIEIIRPHYVCQSCGKEV